MKKIIIVVGIVLIVCTILYNNKKIDGFVDASLPSSPVLIHGFRIYASINNIIDKIPFFHTRFSKVINVSTGAIEWEKSRDGAMPTGTTPALYEFEFHSDLPLQLTTQMMTDIKTASTELFNREDALGYVTSTGVVYPVSSKQLITPSS